MRAVGARAQVTFSLSLTASELDLAGMGLQRILSVDGLSTHGVRERPTDRDDKVRKTLKVRVPALYTGRSRAKNNKTAALGLWCSILFGLVSTAGAAMVGAVYAPKVMRWARVASSGRGQRAAVQQQGASWAAEPLRIARPEQLPWHASLDGIRPLEWLRTVPPTSITLTPLPGVSGAHATAAITPLCRCCPCTATRRHCSRHLGTCTRAACPSSHALYPCCVSLLPCKCSHAHSRMPLAHARSASQF